MAHPSPVPVVLFLSRFLPGGTENQMLELARRLDRNRFTVYIACFHREGAWLQRAEESATAVVDFPITGFAHVATLRQMQRFANWCREHDIAIVHATDLYANVFALPAAMLAGVPVRLGNRREITVGKTTGLLTLQRMAYACAHRVIANSSAAAARLEYERVRREHISVIPNGVDAAAFPVRTPRSTLRRIVTVANLRPEKAHDVLMDAAEIVLERHPDAEFWCVGGGVLSGVVPAEARRRGLDRMTFFGHRDDVPDILAQADIYALPSRSEAMPNGVIEAMAAGLPIVSTHVGGIPELVTDGEHGRLVRPDDAQALAAALMDVMSDPARAAAYGEAARRKIEERFSFERMVNAFEQLYLEELAARAPRRAAAALLQTS